MHKEPVIPYRPVSAGGHEGASSQSMPTQAPTNSSAELNALNGNNSPVPSQGIGISAINATSFRSDPPLRAKQSESIGESLSSENQTASAITDPRSIAPRTIDCTDALSADCSAKHRTAELWSHERWYPPVQYTPNNDHSHTQQLIEQ